MNEITLNGESMDIVIDNIQKLKAIFPEVFCEDSIDFEKLQAVLGNYTDSDNERYNFTWWGKSQALRLAQTPSTGTLRPCKEESKDWYTTQNLYIEGDNLEVLKLLQKTYHGKVKMIYIDPPYNTGRDFVYPDNYKDNLQNYLEMTGQVDNEGNKNGTNSDTSGRYHTNWLNMMYPRLRLARNLLTTDGIILISIDDNEINNLKKLCDEVFGEENFASQFVWKKRTGANDSQNGISNDHEYILCYFKTSQGVFNGIDKDFTNYKNPDNDPRGDWMADNLTCNKTAIERPNLAYSITDPNTGTVYECNPNRVWAYEQERMNRMIQEGKVIFPKNSSGTPMYKRHKNELRSAKKPFSSIIDTKINAVATKEVRDLFGTQVFNYPKSIDLVTQLINQCTTGNDLILDFFSGSATTAHATLYSNITNDWNNKFILVQLPEKIDSNTSLGENKYNNLCEIGKERIRRAGEKLKDESNNHNIDYGFRVLKLDSSNIKKWSPDYDNIEQTLFEQINNFVEGRTELDVVFEIMLKYGIDLTFPIEEYTICDKKVFSIGFGALVICLDDDITTDLATGIINLKEELEPDVMRVVFRDNGFKNDAVKTNIKEIFKVNGIDEMVSI